MKTSELNHRIAPLGMEVYILALIILAAFVCGAAEEGRYKPILYPTIFWHNNQWETYENGKWAPYHGSVGNNTIVEAEPEEPIVLEPVPGPDNVETNNYVPAYGWGFIGAPAFYPVYPPNHRYRRAHFRREQQRPAPGIGERKAGPGRTAIGIGRPNTGIGQPTIGVGRPNAAIGQPTIGIGEPNAGIGQPTVGIGRPNVAIGQQNAGPGSPTIGAGQPNVGIGQNNAGIGQNNTGLGQPNVGIGQPNVGIGQQTWSSQQSSWSSQRPR